MRRTLHCVLSTHGSLRVLGPADLEAVTTLLARDPVVNVMTDYRARTTELRPRWLNGEVWGFYEGDELVSVCHAAANLMPSMATPAAVDSFTRRALRQGRRCSTILGPSEAVDRMWEQLSERWPEPRDIRRNQPHLEISGDPLVPPDPMVRRATPDEFGLVYPACVAMYTEEVGVSPEANDGASLYRTRVSQLISRGWSYVRIDGGRVVFKAEVAAVSPHACQIQGVYVHPDLRGRGLAVTGMAAVVKLALADVAPVVSLYVNEQNYAARRVYEKVGFRETATFTTIMW